jgi:hypothetical protein
VRASAACFVYDMALNNRVFALIDELLLATAISGPIIYIGNKEETLVSSGLVGAGDSQRGD